MKNRKQSKCPPLLMPIEILFHCYHLKGHAHESINNSTREWAIGIWLCANKIKRHTLVCQESHTSIFRVEERKE